MNRVVWLQGPHEMWFRPSPNFTLGEPRRVFAEIARVLSSHGKLLIIDNLAPPGLPAEAAGQLHRSDPDTLRIVAEASGLVLIEQDRDWTVNPVDPLDRPTHDRRLHLKTTQFLQVYRCL